MEFAEITAVDPPGYASAAPLCRLVLSSIHFGGFGKYTVITHANGAGRSLTANHVDDASARLSEDQAAFAFCIFRVMF